MKLPPYQSQTLDNNLLRPATHCHFKQPIVIMVQTTTVRQHVKCYNQAKREIQNALMVLLILVCLPVSGIAFDFEQAEAWRWFTVSIKATTKSIYNNIQYTIVTNYTGIKTFKVNIKAWQNMTQNLHSTNTRIYRLI